MTQPMTQPMISLFLLLPAVMLCHASLCLSLFEAWNEFFFILYLKLSYYTPRGALHELKLNSYLRNLFI